MKLSKILRFRLICLAKAESMSESVLNLRSSNAASTTSPSADHTMKLDIIVNPSLKTTLVKLDEDTIRTMFENYANVMGSAPADHEEPTSEQLSGVYQLVSSGNVPYIDLAMFGPHGSRFIKKMKTMPSSSSDTPGQSVADIPGPPDFRT